MAIHRARTDRDLAADLGSVRLRAGDVLLVQGSKDAVTELRESGSMLVLDATTDLPHTARAPLALAIMGVVVVLAATSLMPISVAALCGVAAMLLTGCLSWKDGGVLRARVETKFF